MSGECWCRLMRSMLVVRPHEAGLEGTCIRCDRGGRREGCLIFWRVGFASVGEACSKFLLFQNRDVMMRGIEAGRAAHRVREAMKMEEIARRGCFVYGQCSQWLVGGYGMRVCNKDLCSAMRHNKVFVSKVSQSVSYPSWHSGAPGGEWNETVEVK